MRASAQATVGPVRLPALAGGPELDIRCDLAINLAEAQMMGDMMDRAARVAVLADSSKFGRRLFAQIADLGRADYLVTDAPPPHDLHDALRARDVEVLVAAD